MVFLLLSFLSCTGDKDKEAKGSGTKIRNSQQVRLERIEWTNMWVEETDDDTLPRLLLIGDSHVQQYYPFVKKELQGLVSFGRYTSSKCLGNPYLLEEVRLFLRQYPCEVIVFNNGLHGRAYPDSVYAAALPAMIRVFREEAPYAHIIWVNTTPVRNRENLQEFHSFTDHVRVRNELAAKFFHEKDIPIVDNWTLGCEHPEYYSGDGVHFNKEGKAAEAHKVAEAVRKVLAAAQP